MKKIVNILAHKEAYSQNFAGAVALCVKDFKDYSIFNPSITILGHQPTTTPLSENYVALAIKKQLFKHKTYCFSQSCLNYIKQHPTDLVEVHNRAFTAQFLAQRLNIPITLHFHNDPRHMTASNSPKKRRQLAQQLHAIYCVSDYIRNCFLEGLPSEFHHKVHSIYNGIALPSTPVKKEKTIIFVGRLIPEKGIESVVNALAKILPKYPDWHALIIGAKSKSNTLKALNHHIDRQLDTLSSQLTHYPSLSHQDTMNHMAKAAIALTPCQWEEPFGRTSLEAMAHHAALITSAKGGIKEMITEDAAFALTTPETKTLAKAIEMLIQNDTLREKLQRQGFARAKRFDIQKCTADLDKIRSQLLSDTPAQAQA